MRWEGHVDYADRELRCIQDFGEEIWGREPLWKPKLIGWAIILKCILETWDRGIDQIYLA